jgi:hypothetical protein
MVVVAGDYRSSLNLRPLPQAVAEGERSSAAGRGALLRDRGPHQPAAEAAVDRGPSNQGAPRPSTSPATARWIRACRGRDHLLDDDWPLDASLFLDAPLGKRYSRSSS